MNEYRWQPSDSEEAKIQKRADELFNVFYTILRGMCVRFSWLEVLCVPQNSFFHATVVFKPWPEVALFAESFVKIEKQWGTMELEDAKDDAIRKALYDVTYQACWISKIEYEGMEKLYEKAIQF